MVAMEELNLKEKIKKEGAYRKELIALFKDSQKRERELKMKLKTFQFYSKKKTSATTFKPLQTEDLDSPLSQAEISALNEDSGEMNLV